MKKEKENKRKRLIKQQIKKLRKRTMKRRKQILLLVRKVGLLRQ